MTPAPAAGAPVRHALADALAAALPDWQVTAHPRPIPMAQTAVVAPGVPYLTRDGFGGLGRTTLEVGFYWSASDPDHDLDHLDAWAIDTAWPALEATGAAEVTYRDVRVVEVGPSVLLLAVFAVAVYVGV